MGSGDDDGSPGRDIGDGVFGHVAVKCTASALWTTILRFKVSQCSVDVGLHRQVELIGGDVFDVRDGVLVVPSAKTLAETGP